VKFVKGWHQPGRANDAANEMRVVHEESSYKIMLVAESARLPPAREEKEPGVFDAPGRQDEQLR
jgi:hypothetical protein